MNSDDNDGDQGHVNLDGGSSDSGADGESNVPIVPGGFQPPLELRTDNTVLRPLDPEHNESDHQAWTSSIQHIRETPGFAGRSWPPEESMPLAQNLSDIVKHQEDFENRTGFTYTILDADDQDRVVGCLYIYPDPTGEAEVRVHSWVTGSRAELDREVWLAVTEWLAERWPFTTVRYAGRP